MNAAWPAPLSQRELEATLRSAAVQRERVSRSSQAHSRVESFRPLAARETCGFPVGAMTQLKSIEVTFGGFRAVAAFNGKTKSNVYVYRIVDAAPDEAPPSARGNAQSRRRRSAAECSV